MDPRIDGEDGSAYLEEDSGLLHEWCRVRERQPVILSLRLCDEKKKLCLD